MTWVAAKPMARRAALLLAAGAAFLGACSSGTTADEGTAVEESTESTPMADSSDDGAVFSVGDLEAGFGPGSLVAAAGAYLDRMHEVRGGWFVGQPYQYFEPPAVCGLELPTAIQGRLLTQIKADSAPFGDVIQTVVMVYDTPDQAEATVGLLNGPTADECDQALRELADETGTNPPGVEFDFGADGGQATETPAAVPEGMTAAARRYEVGVAIGTLEESLLQLTAWIADGRYLILTSTTVIDGEPDQLATELLESLLATPGPDIVDDVQLDEAAMRIRRSVLTGDDLPEFFQPNERLWFPPDPNDDPCQRTDGLAASAEGPQYVALSPGTGASEVRQSARIYRDTASAEASFTEALELGPECFQLRLPDSFIETDSSFETVEVDGVTVVRSQTDLDQMIGGQAFAVEAGAAEAQVDNIVYRMAFVGLAGDSPDLAELVVAAIRKAEADE